MTSDEMPKTPTASLTTDAGPATGEHAPLVFLAGAIKYWWEPGMWDSALHREYVRWRNDVRAALIEAGCLTYAPHEAFKGTWNEAAQAVNDAGIAAADLVVVLSPPDIPTEGTDDEVVYAERVNTPVVFFPPGSGVEAVVEAVLTLRAAA